MASDETRMRLWRERGLPRIAWTEPSEGRRTLLVDGIGRVCCVEPIKIERLDGADFEVMTVSFISPLSDGYGGPRFSFVPFAEIEAVYELEQREEAALSK